MKTVDGIPFECTQCGACCRWEGVVNLTPEDIKRLAKFKGIEESECVEEYTNHGKTLKNKEKSKDCVFLKDNGCTVWDAKPKQCKDYPKKYTSKCPGFKTDRSESMNDYSVAVKMAKERMDSTQDFSRTVSDNLYKDLSAGLKTAHVASMAIAEGIDSYLSDSTIKVASLDDLFSFDRVDKSHLIHKATKDLWNINTDKDGAVQITRLFDATGEPIQG
jgi:uncharacterized protein